jgi:hypothetical protein
VTGDDLKKYVYASDYAYSMKWGGLNTVAVVLGGLAVITAACAGWKRPAFWDDGSADGDNSNDSQQHDPDAARAMSELEMLKEVYSSLTSKHVQSARLRL